jgi:uncharacterized membrane protein YgaE (UPF0421/DUF939 family)
MGIRVIKTAIAVVIAIYTAGWLSLSSPLSAGLLAVLGVEVTRKRTLRNAFQRFGSSVLGLLFAAAIFHFLGFHIWVIAIFILIAYPILARVNLKDGIVTSSVIVFHVFGEGEISTQILWNEILLLFIGLGSGTLINLLYMPGSEDRLVTMKNKLEQLLSDIFIYIAKHLRDNQVLWDGQELLDAEQTVQEALNTASRSAENQLFRFDHYWFIYFHMRKQQLDTIHRMVDIVAQIYKNLPHGEMVAELFEELSRDVKTEYYTGNVTTRLQAVEEKFKDMDLPQTRSEFEVRASILQLALELKHYMSIAQKEKKKAPH